MVPSPSSSSASPGPVGRPAALDVRLLSNDEWWSELLRDASHSREIEASTYCYDDPQLQEVLLERLRAGAKVRLSIDRESLGRSVPHFQKSRVAALMREGAEVFSCVGPRRGGCHHKKGVVLDRRVVYCGGNNLTAKSRSNGESMFKMVGPIVSFSTKLNPIAKTLFQSICNPTVGVLAGKAKASAKY